MTNSFAYAGKAQKCTLGWHDAYAHGNHMTFIAGRDMAHFAFILLLFDTSMLRLHAATAEHSAQQSGSFTSPVLTLPAQWL